ncbi:bifunctional 5,10-methylenetetrahydrofolate dehydrogenase/5,10-methenyltetrahydrofolate cyclohydrolase [Patescibacteria group bacterium]
MIIDGKKLAAEIKESLKAEISGIDKELRLAVIQVDDNPVTERFLTQKKKFGEDIGVDVRVYELPKDISTNALRKKVAEVVHIKQNTAVIVQLPLPNHINTQYILDGIIVEKDADVLSSKGIGMFETGRSKIIPPVVATVKYILDSNNIYVKGKNAVVVGRGRLVGKPVSIWLNNNGAAITSIDENTLDPRPYTLSADLIISGAGKPGIITADMVKDGVIIIDAGTSESEGRLVGDVDPSVEEKASLFTPVPGGVGPLTVAMLFKNLFTLAQ